MTMSPLARIQFERTVTVPLPPSKEFLAFLDAAAGKPGVSGHDFGFFHNGNNRGNSGVVRRCPVPVTDT
ncbi:hypothetical protein [Antarctobacter sp.]|uniref:hypothetical protein n=1 Tax=Antarctobacter sp. TaxID=1872577 RepID=UPI002B266F9F|nr:hypothetical protein [Antarctobacter sp.]